MQRKEKSILEALKTVHWLVLPQKIIRAITDLHTIPVTAYCDFQLKGFKYTALFFSSISWWLEWKSALLALAPLSSELSKDRCIGFNPTFVYPFALQVMGRRRSFSYFLYRWKKMQLHKTPALYSIY